jgi:hypothetical protein
MLEGDLKYTLLSVMAGLICLILGLYAYRRNPTLRSTKAFLCTMSVASAASFLAFLIANSPDEGTAEGFARALTFVGTFVWMSYIYLVLLIPVERKGCWALANRKKLAILAVAIATAPALLNYPLRKNQFGYWFDSSTNLFIWSILTLFILIVPVFLMAYMYIGATDKTVKRNAVILGVGVLLPTIAYLFEWALTQAGVVVPHLLPVGLLLTGVVFMLSQFRYKVFLIEPVKEVRLEQHLNHEPLRAAGVDMAGGHCDLVKSKRSDPAYRIFVDEIAAGKKGLIITRMHPDQVRERYGLVKTPVLWLSGQPGPERVDPASLSILQHTIVDFLQKDPSSIILLDGLEYLMAENTMDKVLRFIYSVHDAVVVSASRFIVALDPEVLGQKELALIEKEFTVTEVLLQASSEPPAAMT